ncbi:A24 family peptidase [Sneathiella glossodoripedis]|uniref:A24 family peptidase n=1 Tax=Sneathiella glossodoripedis TaxID=418853 RepID=UPI000470356C|nr:prepilin peptidase [Sneathiella glossodoripedis]
MVISFMNIAWHSLLPVYVCVLLVVASWSDICARRIPNWVCFHILLCYAVYSSAANENGLIGNGLLAGSLALAAFFPLFLLKVLGAGDVKLITVMAFWIGMDHLISFFVMISVMGIPVAFFYLMRGVIALQLVFIPLVGVRVSNAITRGPSSVPYAVAISSASIYLMLPLITGDG